MKTVKFPAGTNVHKPGEPFSPGFENSSTEFPTDAKPKP